MNQQDETVSVSIIDPARCLLASNLDTDTTMTLIALVSEDPADWEEAMSVWDRYRTPVVCEFISSLPFEATTPAEVIQVCQSSEAWVVIDFTNKRVCTGGAFMPVGRDAVFAMVEDESGKQHCPLSVHLPPWWELHEAVAAEVIGEPRQTPVNRPHLDRNALYGDLFLKDVATRVLDVVESAAWHESNASNNEQERYPFTVAVHRDWLMTPQESLVGRIPRELLHGATSWMDKVTWGQRLRFEDGGPMIAAPDDWSGYATAPMGSQEMCLYFDFCREVIGAAWFWCKTRDWKTADEPREIAISELMEFLRQVKEQWLEGSFEGGSPPKFVIECDRRRVPRGAGVPIEGVDGVQTNEHIADCDCPICEMMAEGVFGIGFACIDGHHLELDEEFAFSTKETFEEWEEQRIEYAEFSAQMDRKWAEREAGEADDTFGSVWSGIREEDSSSDDTLSAGDSPFAGRHGGHLKMAFMVAEIVSELEMHSASGDEIQALNESFGNYRRSDGEDRQQFAAKLKSNLQSLAEHYPFLVSRSADLQSRIDETERILAARENEDDCPF